MAGATRRYGYGGKVERYEEAPLFIEHLEKAIGVRKVTKLLSPVTARDSRMELLLVHNGEKVARAENRSCDFFAVMAGARFRKRTNRAVAAIQEHGGVRCW